MKKRRLIPVLAAVCAAVCIGAVGCGTPKKGETDQGGANIFPVSTYEDGLPKSMGDVMPFYDDGVMHVYHLQDTRGSNSLFYHPISRVTTTDFVHYTDEGVAINFEEDISSPDAALGTGSFIKDENGVYHCFYTGHNSELKPVEVIRHAVSRDGQKTWQKQEEFNLYGDCDDFRDPYVYYDGADECYYMLVTTRVDNCGVIKRYSAQSLDASANDWNDCGVFFRNDAGTYNMECPSYIELNGYYYLAYSEQGDNRVTHYRYKSSEDGAWQKFERDSIDASGFYAGRLEKAGDELYAFAWCAKLTGGFGGGFDWAGSLVTHRLKQLSNGELCAVMVSSVKDAFSHKVGYKLKDGKALSALSYDGEKFRADCVEELSENITRINFKIELNDYNGDFGLTFGLDGAYDNRLSNAVVAFEAKNSRLVCYNEVSSIIRYGSALASVPFGYATGKNYNVDIIIDGEILTVYLDDTVALTVRLTGIGGANFAFYSNGASAQIKEITFYE